MTAKSSNRVNQTEAQATAQPVQGVLQRKCACGQHTLGKSCSACSKDDESVLKRSTNRHNPAAASSHVPQSVHDVLRSPGAPLDAQARAFMEPRFGRDFSDVRIHTDSRAAQSAGAVGALAYTLGKDIVFGNGNYSPHTREGKSLLAHELTHVAQNRSLQRKHSTGISIGPENDHYEAEADRNAHAIARGDSDPMRIGASSSEPGRLSRATMAVGATNVDINYSNVVHVTVTDYESSIETTFTSWTGSPATVIHTELTALSSAAKEWVLFALDLLVDNPITGLNKIDAVKRLIEYAPLAKHRAVGNPDNNFEHEALSVSGWFEKALTSGLTKPTGVKASFVQQRLSTGSGGGSTCPSPRTAALDVQKLKTDMPVELEAYLKKVQVISNTKNQPMAPLQKLGDSVQEKARSFYAPYADHSRGRGNTLVQQWQYSSHMVSSQSAAGTPSTELRVAYLDSRARIVGDQGLFNTVNFDSSCDTDNAELETIVTQMEPKTNIQALIDPILRQKSYTNQNVTPKQVIINPQVSAQTDDCEARWKTVRTICHELMHVMVHDDFRRAEKGRMIMREGWPEVLGHYLYEEITGDAALKPKMEEGLANKPCASIPGSTIGYGDAGKKAEEIRIAVKNPNFRAAFFLGQLELGGIQPKLSVGTSNDPLEHEADRIAEQAVNSPGRADASVAPPHIQRYTIPVSTNLEAPANVDHVLSGSGKPLEPGLRRDMETRLGHDFSRVRVHSDDAAAQSAQTINAEAYTMGHNIVFGPGKFEPTNHAGRRLLAHELTHVVQQSNASLVQRKCNKDLGAPTPDCTPSKQGVAGWQFLFKVACDELLPGEEANIEKFKPGSKLNIHGFASRDGTEAFNDQLSCHRANKIAELARAKRADCPVAGIFKQGESPPTGPGVAPDPNPRSFWRSVIVEEVKPTLDAGEVWIDPTRIINEGWDLHRRAQQDPTTANLDVIAARRLQLKKWLEELPKTLAPPNTKLNRRHLDHYRRLSNSATALWTSIDQTLAINKHSAATTDTFVDWSKGTGTTDQGSEFHAKGVPTGAKYHIDIFGEGYFGGAINLGMAERTTTTGISGTRVPNLIYRRFSGSDAAKNKIPIADKTADLVTAENGPIGYPGLAEEVARIIAPGGTIVLYNPESEEATHDKIAKLTGGTVTKTRRDGALETKIVLPEP